MSEIERHASVEIEYEEEITDETEGDGHTAMRRLKNQVVRTATKRTRGATMLLICSRVPARVQRNQIIG
jgi:hypothetical protein